MARSSNGTALSRAQRDALMEMQQKQDRGRHSGAEIVCDGRQCWLGGCRVSTATVRSLLRLVAISEEETSPGVFRYTINDCGRALLKDESNARRVLGALAAGRPFTFDADLRFKLL